MVYIFYLLTYYFVFLFAENTNGLKSFILSNILNVDKPTEPVDPKIEINFSFSLSILKLKTDWNCKNTHLIYPIPPCPGKILPVSLTFFV